MLKEIKELQEKKNNLDNIRNIKIKRKIEFNNSKNKEIMFLKHQVVIVEVQVKKNLNNQKQVILSINIFRCLIKRNFRSQIKYKFI